MSFRKLFGRLSTKSTISVFDHERSFGIVVEFVEKGFGFGEIVLCVDKATGEARCDLESMSPKHCGEILMRAVGTYIGRNE